MQVLDHSSTPTLSGVSQATKVPMLPTSCAVSSKETVAATDSDTGVSSTREAFSTALAARTDHWPSQGGTFGTPGPRSAHGPADCRPDDPIMRRDRLSPQTCPTPATPVS